MITNIDYMYYFEVWAMISTLISIARALVQSGSENNPTKAVAAMILGPALIWFEFSIAHYLYIAK